MYYTKGFIRFAVALGMCGVLILAPGPLNPDAYAEQGYDVDVCFSLEFTPLIKSPEITIVTFDGKGIMRSNGDSKVFDNCTVHSQGVHVFEGKGGTIYAYMKYLDPGGDFVIFRYTQSPGEKAATTTIMMGTGKWKGVTGGGKATRTARGKPVATGLVQACNKHTGTFTLPK